MKKKLLCTGAMLLCLVMLLAACKRTPSMKYDEGYYSIPGSDVKYTFVSLYYEAIAYDNSDPLAILKQGGDLPVYKISNVDADKMLCTEDYDVLCAQGVALPAKLSGFDPFQMHITQTAVLSYSVATVTEAADLEALVTCYETERGFYSGEIDFLERESYDLKFQSKTCAGLYYCLGYWELKEPVELYVEIEDPDDFENLYPAYSVKTELYEGDYYAVYDLGTSFFYDMEKDLCYPAGDLLAKYLADVEV